METTLVTIAQFDDNFEADLAKALLEDNGINAWLKNAITYSMVPGIAPERFYIELQVSSEDEILAREILSGQRSSSEIRDILVAEQAILEGHFQLTSGKHSNMYIEKIRLFQNPAATLRICELLAELLEPLDYDTVVGPAYGGIVLAFEVSRINEANFLFTQRKDEKMTIREGFDLSQVKKAVIVEDILTTGGSVKEVIACLEDNGIEVVAVAAIVDRGGGKVDFGCPFLKLLELDIPAWEAEDCELCRQGIVLSKPGSSDKKI